MEGRPQEKTNDDVPSDDKTLKTLVHEFLGYTTAHGVARLADAKTTFLKIFWTVVCLGATAMFLVQVNKLFEQYLSKPVSTSIKINFEKKLAFPAVTICNLNMLRADEVPDSVMKEMEKKGYTDTWSDEPDTEVNYTDPTKSPASTNDPTADNGEYGAHSEAFTSDSSADKAKDGAYKDYSDYEYSYKDYDYYGDYYGDVVEEYPTAAEIDQETKLRIEINQVVGGSDAGKRYRSGHLFEDLVKNCTWKGVDCKHGNMSKSRWKRSWNYRYGNCYTFNSGLDEDNNPVKILSTSKQGPSHGLILQLNIEQDQYIGPLTIEAGVRVLLHAQGVMPFPFEEGFSVSPGMATSVGIKKTKIVRLDRFNNKSCLASHHLAETNIYRKYRNITFYSQQACLHSCLGSSQFAMCSCSEIAYPSKDVPCDIFNSTTARCLKHVKRLYNDDKLECIHECRQSCTEEIIQKTISTTQWPSTSYKVYLGSKGTNMEETDDMLYLNIFYNELNYENIEEKFSYGTENLLADIGGQLGLWIGISALTCCELLELLMKIFGHLIKKCDKRNRVEQLTPPYGYH